MDAEADLIAKVTDRVRRRAFFESVLLEDQFDDWSLARQFGEFLARQDPEGVMGHALVARACRHLGELEQARAELEECRARTPRPAETELFASFLEQEGRLLGESTTRS